MSGPNRAAEALKRMAKAAAEVMKSSAVAVNNNSRRKGKTNPYMQFLKDYRMKNSLKGVALGEASKAQSAAWKALSAADKEHWSQMARELNNADSQAPLSAESEPATEAFPSVLHLKTEQKTLTVAKVTPLAGSGVSRP